jgi:prepilin-type N-terminal cleavage/methylation domain-containing protein
MIQKLQTRRGGFTLVEIMIVVAIIALLAALAVPNFLRARKRSQATRVLEDLRILDAATDQYAIENNKTSLANANFTDLKYYIKAGTVLYSSSSDVFGDAYGGQGSSGPGTFTVDQSPDIPQSAWVTLSDVAPYTFWSPYHN